jgi:DNA-binding MurR/RpiR family transcriptional regulator
MPLDAHSLADRLRSDYERFSPAQQALARYLVDRLPELPLLSAHEVAAAAHCSPATVVRFAQALGYAGYPEMQRAVRTAQRPALAPRRAGQLGLVVAEEGIEPALAADRLELDDALARIGSTGLAPLISALADRSPLVIVGEGFAEAVAAVVAERLERAGRLVVRVGGTAPRDRARLSAMGPRSGLLAIAVGGETRAAEEALAAARAAGVPAASLVDSSLSPVARTPLARVVPADDRGGAPGLVAMVAVGQVLAAGLVSAAAVASELLAASA